MRIVVRRVLLGTVPIVAIAGMIESAIGDSAVGADTPTHDVSGDVPTLETLASGSWSLDELAPFDERVGYVVRERSTLVLADGTTVALAGETELELEGIPTHAGGSMDAVHDALEAGWAVRATGTGVPREDGRLTATALALEAEVGDFDARVRAVDPGSGGLILEDGSFVHLTDGTDVTDPEGRPVRDLSVIEASLRTGGGLRASGVGYVLGGATEDEGTPSYQALTVALVADRR